MRVRASGVYTAPGIMQKSAPKRSEPTARTEEVRRRRWTFLTNHATVLLHVARNPDDTISLIAAALDLTGRTTAYVLSDLRAAGYIDVRRIGRHNRYKVRTGKPLRRETHRRAHVRDLLESFSALG